jgi:hypothetical protein
MSIFASITGLFLLGVFIILFAGSFVDIVAGSALTGTTLAWLSIFPFVILLLGAFALMGAIFAAYRLFVR